MIVRGVGDIGLLFGFALFFGLGYGVAQPLFTSMIADLFQGNSLGSIMGWIVAISGVGSALGPPLAGYIYDQFGRYRIAFINALLCVILSCVFGWLAGPRNVRRPGRTWRQKAIAQSAP